MYGCRHDVGDGYVARLAAYDAFAVELRQAVDEVVLGAFEGEVARKVYYGKFWGELLFVEVAAHTAGCEAAEENVDAVEVDVRAVLYLCVARKVGVVSGKRLSRAGRVLYGDGVYVGMEYQQSQQFACKSVVFVYDAGFYHAGIGLVWA